MSIGLGMVEGLRVIEEAQVFLGNDNGGKDYRGEEFIGGRNP